LESSAPNLVHDSKLLQDELGKNFDSYFQCDDVKSRLSWAANHDNVDVVDAYEVARKIYDTVKNGKQ
jgi:hypothetical protein